MAFELDTFMEVGVVRVANLEKLKEELKLALEEFKSVPLTKENTLKLKEARARLNKAGDSFNKRRIELGRAFLKPFDNFKQEVDSVIEMIDSVSRPIDLKLKEFEKEDDEAKRLSINALFKDIFKKSYLQVEHIWREEWMNSTYSLDKIKQDIQYSVNKIESDLKIVDMLSDYGHDEKKQIKMHYIDSLAEERLLELSIRWFKEKEKRMNEYFEDTIEEAEVVFKVVGNYEELVKLSKFLKENNYNYKKIK